VGEDDLEGVKIDRSEEEPDDANEMEGFLSMYSAVGTLYAVGRWSGGSRMFWKSSELAILSEGV
jgi:hypothetical protein